MFAVDAAKLRLQIDRLIDMHWPRLAGVVFMAAALLAIEYDEVIAPQLTRVSTAWSAASLDVGRRLAGFSL